MKDGKLEMRELPGSSKKEELLMINIATVETEEEVSF